ncbi:MAG: PAS domain S-box protein, partial [Armatimonadetes bacterium]|nr:PAS domain S-box protein [Armatimonadota bacterium]
AVVEGMRDGVIVVDWQDRIVDLNPAAREVVSPTSQDLVGRPIGEVLQVWNQLAPTLPFVPHAHAELSATVGGVERRFAVGVSPLQQRSARLQGRLIVLHDITALKASQEAVQRSEQRYRTLFEASGDAIFVTGADGRIVDCNQSACSLYRSSRERLTGLAVVELVRPDSNDEGGFLGLGPTGTGRFVPAWGQRADGSCFPAEVGTQPVQVGGDPLTVVFVRDVTERKQAESHWQGENTLLRSIAENAPLALYVVDGRDDRVLYANQRFRDLWGLPPMDADPGGEGVPTGEEIGAALQRQVSDPAAFGELWARLRGEIPRTVVEQDLALADGRTLRWFSTQVRDSHGHYFGRLHIFEDNSDRKRAEDTQRLAAVGQLAAGVAHEFNNILCSMRLRADLAHLRRTPSEYDELVRVVVEGAKKGAQICDDMLSFARPAPPQRVSAPIEEPLEAALSLAERRLAAAPIAVQREYRTEGWRVSIDPGQMEHVFLNLILNACDAMPDGGTLSLRTWFEPLAGGQVVVEISDTGCGIRPEDLPRVFEPFFTTKGLLGASELPATGLGLAVSHGLLRAHHATISVRSEWGQGAVFEIRFEAHERSTESTAEAEPALPTRRMASPGRVLVVEDEDEVRATVEEALQSEGYEVVTVSGVPEAKSLLESEAFDLVVTDMLMPGGSGRTVVQTARRAASSPPVVVITGKPDPALEQEMRLAGAAQVVAKPFGLSELLAAVRPLGRGPHGQG